MKRIFVIVALIAAIGVARAADLALPPVSAPPAPPLAPRQSEPAPPVAPEPPSIHAYGSGDKTCLAWTDSCRICQRTGENSARCSNVGFACQPKDVTCTRR